MNEEKLFVCIKDLKEITTEQGKQIAVLTANFSNIIKDMENMRIDFKDIYSKINAHSIGIKDVSDWQTNFEKNQTDKLTLLGIMIAGINVFTVIIAFVLGRTGT